MTDESTQEVFDLGTFTTSFTDKGSVKIILDKAYISQFIAYSKNGLKETKKTGTLILRFNGNPEQSLDAVTNYLKITEELCAQLVKEAQDIKFYFFSENDSEAKSASFEMAHSVKSNRKRPYIWSTFPHKHYTKYSLCKIGEKPKSVGSAKLLNMSGNSPWHLTVAIKTIEFTYDKKKNVITIMPYTNIKKATCINVGQQFTTGEDDEDEEGDEEDQLDEVTKNISNYDFATLMPGIKKEKNKRKKTDDEDIRDSRSYYSSAKKTKDTEDVLCNVK